VPSDRHFTRLSPSHYIEASISQVVRASSWVRSGEVIAPTLDFKFLHPCPDLEGPWKLYRSTPLPILNQAISHFLPREEIIRHILGGMLDYDRSTGIDFAYINQAMNKSQFQWDWGGIMMPPFCADSSAAWLISHDTAPLARSAPITHAESQRPYIQEVASRHVVAGTLSNTLHFHSYLIAFPRHLDHGYVLCMDPLSRDIDQEIYSQVVNIAKNLLRVKKTNGELPVTPRMKAVTVTHPARFTQILGGAQGDVACSFWATLQAAHWLWAYRKDCKMDPDRFVKFLDESLDTRRGNYDFNLTKNYTAEVDREDTMLSLRRHGCLALQYLAQVADLQAVVDRKGLSGEDFSTFDELLKGDPGIIYQYLTQVASPDVFEKYVMAGTQNAAKHYFDLLSELSACGGESEKRRMLSKLPLIDLVRISLSAVEQRSADRIQFRWWAFAFSDNGLEREHQINISDGASCQLFLNAEDLIINEKAIQAIPVSSDTRAKDRNRPAGPVITIND